MRQVMARAVWAIVGAAFLLGTLSVRADVEGNPYKVIWERNAFGLKPPPPPKTEPPPPPPPEEPPANVRLTGITTILGDTRVLLEITVSGKGKQAEVKKPILRVGEREGDIEIVSVDVDKGVVKIRNRGKESTLDFEKSKTQAAAASKTVAKGRVPYTIPGKRAVPTVHRATLPTTRAATPSGGTQPIVISSGSSRNSSGSSGVMVLGGNPLPQPAAPAAATTRTRAGNVSPSRTYTRPPTAAGLRSVPTPPTRPVRTPTKPSTPKDQAAHDIAQQYLIMRAQQIRARQEGVPFPPLPPIPGAPTEPEPPR